MSKMVSEWHLILLTILAHHPAALDSWDTVQSSIKSTSPTVLAPFPDAIIALGLLSVPLFKEGWQQPCSCDPFMKRGPRLLKLGHLSPRSLRIAARLVMQYSHWLLVYPPQMRVSWRVTLSVSDSATRNPVTPSSSSCSLWWTTSRWRPARWRRRSWIRYSPNSTPACRTHWQSKLTIQFSMGFWGADWF